MIKTQTGQPRWILAFDASCGTCREISDAVSLACGGKLEALPLAHADVRQWRERSLGPDAPSAPTLLRVDGDDVRVWTGTAMAMPLARRLGPRASLRVLRALGQLRSEATSVPFERPGVMDRAGFFKLGAGLAVAAGVIVVGSTPAFAEMRCATVAAWAAKNKGRLPQGYDEIVAYPMAFRRAIFAALPATSKSRLWTEQLTRYQAAHDLTAEQAAVINEGLRLARPEQFARSRSPEFRRSLDDLGKSSVAAFGRPAARALFATLGSDATLPAGASRPSTATVSAAMSQPSAANVPAEAENSCSCSTADSWCDNNTYCQSGFCAIPGPDGCGLFYQYECDGLCIQ